MKSSRNSLPFLYVKIQENKDWNAELSSIPTEATSYVKIQENKDWNKRRTVLKPLLLSQLKSKKTRIEIMFLSPIVALLFPC